MDLTAQLDSRGAKAVEWRVVAWMLVEEMKDSHKRLKEELLQLQAR
jgi:hypothetical protein